MTMYNTNIIVTYIWLETSDEVTSVKYCSPRLTQNSRLTLNHAFYYNETHANLVDKQGEAVTALTIRI